MAVVIGRLAAALVAACLLTGADAGAYGPQVHFFSNASILDNSLPQASERQRRLITFCAELPDETKAFDAVGQYARLLSGSSWHWITWSVASRRGAEQTREMITVQQLLHGLTGGRPDELERTVDRIVEDLAGQVDWARTDGHQADLLCAIGFAVHILGDSRSHRRLEGTKMYPTGRGHAGDGNKPDSVVGSAVGVPGWRAYVSDLPPKVRRNSRFDPSKLQPMFDGVDQAIETAGHDWKEAKPGILEQIRRSGIAWPVYPTMGTSTPWQKRHCQEYVNETFQAGVLPGCAPSCRQTWGAFAQAAIPAFAALHPSRSPDLRSAEYVTPHTADLAPWRPPDSACP